MSQPLPVANRPDTRPPRWRRQDGIRVGVVLWLVICWFLGSARPAVDLDPFNERAWPEAESFEPVGEDIFRAVGPGDQVLGYVSTGTASGYGGPLTVAVAVDSEGTVQALAVVEHRETPTFFRKILSGRILSQFVGKSYGDPMALDTDIDAVSGASRTSLALTQSVRRGTRQVAGEALGLGVSDERREVVFGLAEVALIALFVVGALRRRMRGRAKKLVRLGTLFTGMILLGFVLNSPFVLAHINMVLLGYWPEWQSHIFWYILIAGLLLFKARKEWNVYCYDFCPFGAVQEFLGKIGGAKPRRVRWKSGLLWAQRILTLAAISLALIFRNPGVTSYEIFGTAFTLEGSDYQFMLLAIIVLTSLFLYRPWCRYLCPLHKNTAEGLFDNTRRIVRTAWSEIRSPRRA